MDSRKVIKYLKQFGQPQTLQAIRDNADDQDISREDLAELVKDGKIEEADGGVDDRDQPITLYAPVED